jgi:hypothetical protein
MHLQKMLLFFLIKVNVMLARQVLQTRLGPQPLQQRNLGVITLLDSLTNKPFWLHAICKELMIKIHIRTKLHRTWVFFLK